MVVDLVAVAVALVDDGLRVELAGASGVVELDRIRPEPHRSAHVGDLFLLGQQVDHRERRLEVELGRVGALHPGDVTGELGDRHLHTQADAQVRNSPLPGDLRRPDLSLDSASAEAPGDQDPGGALELGGDLGLGDAFGVDPVDSTFEPWWMPAWRSASTTDR